MTLYLFSLKSVKISVSRNNGHRTHAVPTTLCTFVRFVKEHFVVLPVDYKVVSFPWQTKNTTLSEQLKNPRKTS